MAQSYRGINRGMDTHETLIVCHDRPVVLTSVWTHTQHTHSMARSSRGIYLSMDTPTTAVSSKCPSVRNDNIILLQEKKHPTSRS